MEKSDFEVYYQKLDMHVNRGQHDLLDMHVVVRPFSVDEAQVRLGKDLRAQ